MNMMTSPEHLQPVRGRGRLWSDQEIETLLKMREEGRTRMEIARELKRSWSSVRCATDRLISEGKTRDDEPQYDHGGNFRKPSWTQAELEVIDRAVKLGLGPKATLAEINALTDTPTRTLPAIKYRLRFHKGLVPKKKPKPKVAKAPAKVVEEDPGRTFHRVADRARQFAFGRRLKIEPDANGFTVHLGSFHFSCPEMKMARDRDELAAWLDAAAEEPYTPYSDLTLVEGLMSGSTTVDDWALQMGVTRDEAVQRFKVISRPVKNAFGVVSTDGMAVLLSLLRERSLTQL